MIPARGIIDDVQLFQGVICENQSLRCIIESRERNLPHQILVMLLNKIQQITEGLGRHGVRIEFGTYLKAILAKKGTLNMVNVFLFGAILHLFVREITAVPPMNGRTFDPGIL